MTQVMDFKQLINDYKEFKTNKDKTRIIYSEEEHEEAQAIAINHFQNDDYTSIEKMPSKIQESNYYDYDKKEAKFLEKSGYIFAATTEEKNITIPIDKYYIPRRCIDPDDIYLSEAICKSVGIWHSTIKKFKDLIPKNVYTK